MSDPVPMNVPLPRPIQKWVRREAAQAGMSQQNFVAALVEQAMEREKGSSLFDASEKPFVPTQTGPRLSFTFIDLFSGIGGLRIGLERVGGKCTFSCEIDKYAQKTYEAWFGERPESDIHDQFGRPHRIINGNPLTSLFGS